ncbi:hypothetical protein J0910_19180 [Nocardiopsis sp. CNT-189]|uniref:hypothetical protein n=1 Tax=Nocardiopsis oceanisediminis TaxID=2816862 RepID=UPI003B37BD24
MLRYRMADEGAAEAVEAIEAAFPEARRPQAAAAEWAAGGEPAPDPFGGLGAHRVLG